ncbi:hypothetical protein CQ14_35820 [Bradyrhizobium lablabi]|uniref:Uncharacterized protein n=1 Tax=Bradyrhizobium lablabi TaxID=722472 RepID=A0A0R3N2M1_9BRAD|nr:hypothetical protein CQ14_35820 [Bradyrhizobium lablabi]
MARVELLHTTFVEVICSIFLAPTAGAELLALLLIILRPLLALCDERSWIALLAFTHCKAPASL